MAKSAGRKAVPAFAVSDAHKQTNCMHFVPLRLAINFKSRLFAYIYKAVYIYEAARDLCGDLGMHAFDSL